MGLWTNRQVAAGKQKPGNMAMMLQNGTIVFNMEHLMLNG